MSDQEKAPGTTWIVHDEGSESRDELPQMFVGFEEGDLASIAKCYETQPLRYIRADLARKVKPLVWACSDNESKIFVAESPFGDYDAYFDPQYGWLVRLDGYCDDWVEYPSEADGFAQCDQAKAAAQADYERRILSALVEVK